MQPELATRADQGLMGAASALAHRLRLPTTLVKFLIVGGIGFCVNQAFLFLFYDSPVFWFFPEKDANADLLHPDVRLLISSVLAVEIAIISQFSLHEAWTFRKRDRSGLAITRFLKFNLSSIVSPIIIVVTINTLTPIIRDASGEDSLAGVLAPYISNGIGVLLGLSWNWTMNTLVIWPRISGGQLFPDTREPGYAGTETEVVEPWRSPLERSFRYLRRQTRAHWTFIKFMISGGVGYLLYQGALFGSYDVAGVEFFIATVVAAEVSITGGFWVRDLWVFTDGPVVKRSIWARFTQYQAKSLVSTLVIVTATVNIMTSGFDVPHWVSTPIGVALGFAWNWGWERGFIWRPQAS